jgi:hypothetical protein
MAWRRWNGWSSRGEHFHYDARQRCFVVEEQRELGSDTAQLGLVRGVEPTEYLAAMAEVRREVQRRSADEWEAGLLIKLYAEATSLRRAQPMLIDVTWPPAFSWARSWETFWRWSPTTQEIQSIRYRNGLNHYLPKLIVDVVEAMIRRHHSDVPEAILACLADEGPGVAARLDQIADSIQMPDSRAMLAVWLASFDRPDDMLHRHSFGDELAANGQHAAHDFVDVCAALAEDILAESGAVVASFTAGYPDGVAGD